MVRDITGEKKNGVLKAVVGEHLTIPHGGAGYLTCLVKGANSLRRRDSITKKIHRKKLINE